ncbi:MAG: 4Fe-4S binding protein [Chloroflexi bacterium]|nr:4Fe-4S binding protein [Chloroflexota bacterium]
MGLLGTGILKGLSVTLKHFFATYTEDLKYQGQKAGIEPRPLRRQNPKNHGIMTVEYPNERIPMPENFRYIPFLVKDTEKNEDKCTSCGICAKVCPPQCIWIVRTEDPVTKRPVPAPKEFYIDTTVCMNCGYCAEFCPFDAIKMDHNYEITSMHDRSHELVFDKDRLTMPDTYHATIHPSDWARELEEKAADEAKKKAAAEAKAAGDARKAAAAAKPAAGQQPGATSPTPPAQASPSSGQKGEPKREPKPPATGKPE